MSLCKVPKSYLYVTLFLKLCTHETTRAKSTLRLPRKILPPPPLPSKKCTQKMLGELLFGSIHNYHVVHRASRSHIWRTTFMCSMQGSAITYQKLWGNDLGVISENSLHEALAITLKYSQQIIYVMILAGVHMQPRNLVSSAGK